MIFEFKKYLFKHLKSLKIEKDDHIVIYCKLSSFGITNKKLAKLLSDSIIEYIGKKGTIIMPSYTFSDKNLTFDIKKVHANRTTSPIIKEFFKNKNIKRCFRPIHSHIGIGSKSKFLLNNKNFNSFGKNTDFDQMKKHNFKSLFLGCSPNEAATFLLHLEYINNVPYRNKITLNKKIKLKNKIKSVKIDYFDKPKNIIFDYDLAFKKLQKLGLKMNSANLRFGKSISFKISDLNYYANILFNKDKYCLVKNINDIK